MTEPYNIINRLVDFWTENMPQVQVQKDKLYQYVQNHVRFGTCDYEIDTKLNPVFFMRFNIEKDVCVVLDLIIREDLRSKGLMRNIIIRNWMRFPFINKIRFDRWKEKRFNMEYDLNTFLKYCVESKPKRRKKKNV